MFPEKRALTPKTHKSARVLLEISWDSRPLFTLHRFHRPRTNQYDGPSQHSRPLSPSPFKGVSYSAHKAGSQADAHHIKPEADAQASSSWKASFSCRVSAGPCRQQGKLLHCSDRRRAQIPLPVLPTRHESVSPIPLHAAA